MGGGCTSLGFGCGIAQVDPMARFRRSATTWLVGADLGWNPVTNLNFDLELMYQSTNQERAERLPRDGLQHGGQADQFFVPGDWHGGQRRLRRPLPHHPLLLIASRSVETDQPRSESSGAFLLAGA